MTEHFVVLSSMLKVFRGLLITLSAAAIVSKQYVLLWAYYCYALVPDVVFFASHGEKLILF